MSNLHNRLKHVLRGLMRSPMFTFVTIVTIGLGIGANAAIFSVINGILLKPLPYPEPERLVSIWQSAHPIGIDDLTLSASDYFTFREENRAFQEIGLWDGASASITGMEAPEEVPALNVTERILPALGIQPALGRWFNPADDRPGTPQTAILTYGYWQRKFGGDPSAIGKRILVGGRPTEIIGVMPRSFRFLDEKPDLILPFRFDRSKTELGDYSYRGLARLKPGATLAMADADVGRMIPIVNTRFPAPAGFSAKLFEEAGILPSVRPLKHDVVGSLGKVLWVLMGSLAVVLLIACANVANLLLVRAEGRQQEFAIRTAVGAGSGQLAADMLLESLLLGLLGGAAGLALADGCLRLLVSLAPPFLPRRENLTIDPPVLWFTLAISLAAGLLFGLIPVIRQVRSSVTTALRAGGRTLSQSREAHRARNTLVVLQMALAVVLLVGSGLMIRTFQALRHIQPGFTDPASLQTFRLYIPESQVKDPVRTLRMYQEIQRKISEIPGVRSAAIGNSVPTDGNNSTDVLYAEDRVYREGQIPPLRRMKYAAPGFFETIGTKLVAGRDFTWTDLYDLRLTTLVSENMARELWRTPAAAIGKRIRRAPKEDWSEIVGVVADVRSDGPDHPAPTTVYWPVMGKSFGSNSPNLRRGVLFAIRSDRAGSQSFLQQVRQAVWSIDADLPLSSVRTAEQVYRRTMARSSFTLVMLGIAGGMALLLGIVGIYGVISYSVSQRTREMGIRIALGAQQGALRAMVVRHGLVVALIGVATGLVAAAAVTRILATLLFGITALDPLTYAAVSAGLLAAAALASYMPARRASTINPVDALRAE